MELGRSVFATERLASAELFKMLSPYFQLVPEVRLIHHDGSKLRIDYVALVREGVEFRTPIFGIEVKVDYHDFKDYTHSLKQCIDYRHSLIDDARSKIYRGQALPFVFLWPDVRDVRDGETYAEWAKGAERVAGKFNVGLIRHKQLWDGDQVIEFMLSGGAFWRSQSGNYGNAHFGMARRRGSA